MSALLAPATPRRIKATHRRRRKIASGRFVQRYYDPEIIRFSVPDPVGPEEDFIKHFNRYNYAQNNPVRYTDPDGRCSSSWQPANEGQAAAVALCIDFFNNVSEMTDQVTTTISRLWEGIDVEASASAGVASVNVDAKTGDLTVGVTPVAYGAEASITASPSDRLVLPFSDNPTDAPVKMEYQAVACAIACAGVKGTYNPGGTVEVKPVGGVGVGTRVTVTPTVNFELPKKYSDRPEAPIGTRLRPNK